MSESPSSGIHLIYRDQHIASFGGPTRKALQIGGNSFSTDEAKILGPYEHVLETEGMTKQAEESEEATLQIKIDKGEEAVLNGGKNSLRVKKILSIAPNDFAGIVKIALALKQITIPVEIAPWVKPEQMTGADLLVTIRGGLYHITPSGDVWTTTRPGVGGNSRNKEKLKTPLHVLLPEFLEQNLQKGKDGKENMKIVQNDSKPALECVTWKGQTVRVAQNGKVYLIDGKNALQIDGYKEEGSLVMSDTLIGRVSFPYPHASIVSLGRGENYTAETRIDLEVGAQGKIEIERPGISPTGRASCSAKQIAFFAKFPTVEELGDTSDDTLKELVQELLNLSKKK